MANSSETGHAKNVANFGKLVSYCTGYGESYNPSNSDISLEALNTTYTASQNALSSVNACLPAYNNAINTRDIAFKPLSRLATRVSNALKATNPGSGIVKMATTLVRKLQGRRATAKLTEEEKQELLEQGIEVKEISSSQLSFDNRIDYLEKLINLLGSIPKYNPNEEELQVASLTTLFDDLKVKNKTAIDATTLLSNTRIERDNILYNEESGMLTKALNVKNYVKSLYGTSSPQYHQISGLIFKRVKI